MKWVMFILIFVLWMSFLEVYSNDIVEQIKILDKDLECVDNNKYDFYYFKEIIVQKGVFGGIKEELSVDNSLLDSEFVLMDVNADGKIGLGRY